MIASVTFSSIGNWGWRQGWHLCRKQSSLLRISIVRFFRRCVSHKDDGSLDASIDLHFLPDLDANKTVAETFYVRPVDNDGVDSVGHDIDWFGHTFLPMSVSRQ